MPDNNYWYVAERGENNGPYTIAMLEERVRLGRFSRSALVWRDGWSSWQPLVVHFPSLGLDPRSRRPEQADGPLRPAGNENASSFAHWSILGISVAALCAFVSGFPSAPENATVFLSWRLATLGCLALTGGLSTLLWLRRLSRSDARTASRRGLAKVLTVGWATVVTLAVLVGLGTTPQLYRIQVARQNFNHYTVETDVLSRQLVIKGLIGPGLAGKVATQLESSTAIDTVTINSNGGLIDEALAVADTIERHRNLTVKAEGSCNSACIIVFMSGQKRVADADLQFGFHAISAITPVAGVYSLQSLGEQDHQAQAFLEARGISPEIIASARALGPDKLYEVPAIHLAEIGAVTQLIDSGNPVSIDRAKWLAVADYFARLPVTAKLGALMRTIDTVDPTMAVSNGPRLWAAEQAKNTAAVGDIVRQIISTIVAKSLPAADDRAVANLVRSLGAEIDFMRERRRWDVCNAFLSGHGFAGLEVPPELASLDFSSADMLVQSAAARQWHPRPLPAWTTALGRSIGASLAFAMLTKGEDILNNGADARVSCDWSGNLVHVLVEKPSYQTAALYRWFATRP